MSIEFGELLETAQPVIDRLTYETGAVRFEVELRRCARDDMAAIRNRCNDRVTVTLPNGTKQFEQRLNEDRLAKFLADHCVQGWQGLTIGAAMALCNLRLPEDRRSLEAEPLAYSAESCRALLQKGIGFAAWVLEQATSLAEAREQQLDREKPTSADGFAATSAP